MVSKALVRVNVPTSALLPTRRPRSKGRRSKGLWIYIGGLLFACAGAPTQAALHGDLPGLKSAIREAEQQGRLGRARVLELAGAVLRRELASRHGPEERFPEVRPCSSNIKGALEEVAAGTGVFAAPAALALADISLDTSVRGLPAARSGSHTALEAREAIGASAGPRRRAFMLDGDADVRRAALQAAISSADPADVRALLEAARLDPDVDARAIAVHALGQLGGASVVLGLRDLWSGAPPEQRRQIVAAWSMPRSFEAGGDRELSNAAELSSGAPAVAAALVLEHRGAGPPGFATSRLLRAMRGADRTERLLALHDAPWSHLEHRAAITSLRGSDDAATRVVSLMRLVDHGAIDARGIDELRKLAADSSASDSSVVVALVARVVLARAGDPSVKDRLRADLLAARADLRMAAAFALLGLEDWPAAAHALGDDSPKVRWAVGCQMLADPSSRPMHGADLAERQRPFAPLGPELVTLLVAAAPG